MLSALVLFVASTAISAVDAAQLKPIGASVNTTSGRVFGHAASNATQVSEYLGIPFAKAPLGNLRFAPPVAYNSSANINASHFGADCPANLPEVPDFLPLQLRSLLGSLSQQNDHLDEDCLFLNVWSKPQTGSDKKPVLIWIYGGGFSYGGTNVSVYNGQYFADSEDVVLVSINYRVNIFGFPGAPNITQNLGLLDQRLAVEWVRDNIAGFGGDPQRITLFGQSAGGASVDFYSYAWTKDPIIAGSIIHSGAADAFGNRLPETAAKSWHSVAAKVGCNQTSASEAAILACMRQPNITWQALEAAAASGQGLASLTGGFGPTVDNVTIFSNYTELAQAGKYIKKPTMAGNCNYEAGLFILITAAAGQTLPQATWDAFNQRAFTCPASNAARYRTEQGVPTWRYYYSGMFPNLLLPTVDLTQAYHTAELPVLFGTSQEASKTDTTWQERALGDYMRGAWAAFAAYPAQGLNVLYNWPKYAAANRTLILLGQNNQTVASYGFPKDVDTTCVYPEPGTANA